MTTGTATAIPDRHAAGDRSRWIALVVLCAGMLMIILDATIVNVALPSIQDDLGFSQSSLAWVVNAYLIAFGGLLLLAGRLGDLVGRRRVFLGRPRALHARVAALRRGPEPGRARRRALRPGRRRRADLGRDPRHDRHDVPRARRAGEGDRRLRVRRVGGRLDRPARRRRADRRRSTGTGSSSSTSRSGSRRRSSRTACSPTRTASASAAAPTLPGALLIVERADARRLHDRRGAEQRLGLGRDARPRRPRGRPAGRLRRPRGDRSATRSCRCGSSARATRRRRTSSRCSWSPGCSGCSSSARCTCSACSATARSTSASRSSPSRSPSPRCRSACPPA